MPRQGPGLPSVAADIRASAHTALRAAAVVLHATVVDKYSTPGLGRVYGKHRASRPGDPPAPDTGALRSSVQLTETAAGFRVGTHLEYAPFLEFGTPTIAPRPAWRPAIDATVQAFRGTAISLSPRER
jgi:phage gpG-like protein